MHVPMCVCRCAQVSGSKCGGQRTSSGAGSLPHQIPWIELRSPGWAASAFACQAVSWVLNLFCESQLTENLM